MAKFKVGDIVRGNKRASNYYNVTCEGSISKVVAVDECGIMRIRVITPCKGAEWSTGETFNVRCAHFDLVKEKASIPDKNDVGSISICRKGKRVIASCGKIKGVASCNPIDDFDYEVGAALALKRLFEAGRAIEPMNARICITKKISEWAKENSDFIVGKIYPIINGKLVAGGVEHPWGADRFTNESDIRAYFNKDIDFVVVVEDTEV
nr:MAG TPA: hypothetical protein [Bacteriophage sp.]